VLLEPLLAAPRSEQHQLLPRSKRQTQRPKLAPGGVSSSKATVKCHEYEFFGFFCVPIYQCSNDNLIKVAAQGLFDPRSTSEDEECGTFDDEYPEDCCPPDRTEAASGSCSASLDVCCLHPNSTAQYKEEYLDRFGCEPNGGFIKGGEVEVDCTPPPDCNLFDTKCCEEGEQTGGPLLVTEPPCVDEPDCELFGEGCCEENPIEPEPACVPSAEDCELFGEGCCKEPEPACVPSAEDCELFGQGCCPGEEAECDAEELLFGDCEPEPTVTTTPVTTVPGATTSRPKKDIPNTPVVEPTCGKRNPRGVDAVPVRPKTGEAKFGEWPHVCAILKKELIGEETGPLKIYQCGASLIDYGIVLTAAHCIDDIKAAELIVRCGEWNTQNEEETLPYQEVQVSAIERHPSFDLSNHKNNFAVLFLEGTGFDAMPHIAPICLPSPCVEFKDENCVANGWGKNKFGSDGRYASILKEVVYPVVERNECQKKLRTTRLGRFFELDKSFICAGGIQGVDTCKGDGGSPLTCKIQGRNSWVQRGIVSWGIGCGEEGVPAVYANVAHVVCWIDDEVKKYFGEEKSSRFGFLPGVDCLGAEPMSDCR